MKPRFTVTYHPSAIGSLASVWLTVPDPIAVQAASDAIDTVLKFHADSVGQQVNGVRQFRMDPIEVHYTVSVDDCYVEVVHLRYVG